MNSLLKITADFFYFIENKYFQLVINAFELLSRDDLFKDLNLKITK